MTRRCHLLIIAIVTASVTSIIISGINIYHHLEPDQDWCTLHHMICTWGGGVEPDPEWWSSEAQLKRIEAAIAKALPPRAWGDLHLPEAAPTYPQQLEPHELHPDQTLRRMPVPDRRP